ncbi:MAG TPA: helix-turn-helix domain-containing protein [Myxococcales bacterium]|jgi:polyketide synthase 12|nr:helix-turn-helix domain-containing protein [Myxococcales bacterium]
MKLLTRYRILNAARAMVAEVGVERVTMRGIAAMANITAPAIYRHFRNKRSRYRSLVDLMFGSLEAERYASAA